MILAKGEGDLGGFRFSKIYGIKRTEFDATSEIWIQEKLRVLRDVSVATVQTQFSKFGCHGDRH